MTGIVISCRLKHLTNKLGVATLMHNQAVFTQRVKIIYTGFRPPAIISPAAGSCVNMSTVYKNDFSE